MQYWEIVTEGLARGSGRYDHHIPSPLDRLDGLSLVGVKALDPLSPEDISQGRMEGIGKWAILSFSPLKNSNGRNAGRNGAGTLPGFDHLIDKHQKNLKNQ